MKTYLPFLVFITLLQSAHALVINEIMSNPVGDDNGREWIEIYNNTDSPVDISSLSISIKGGSFVSVIPVSGGTVLEAHRYAIVGSTVSGTTRFTQDYSSYSGPLFRSSISLVNTGVTSLEIKLQGNTVDTLASYTAAKEGNSYSLFAGGFGTGSPTPGEENKALLNEEETVTTTTQTGTQTTLPQSAPPSADITLYLPKEKVVVAGAPTSFTVFSSTQAGKMIDNMIYTWGFGDGGQAIGSSTTYRYLYPGRYVALVEGTNGLVAGTGKMIVRVVSPDIILSSIATGKYGLYVDITNPNSYDLDISHWRLVLDGVPFSFPKNTILAQGITRFPGSVLGFASTTVSSSTVIKLLFQNMDEVTRVIQGEKLPVMQNTIQVSSAASAPVVRQKSLPVSSGRQQPSISSSSVVTKTTIKKEQKDVRLATFFKSLFGK